MTQEQFEERMNRPITLGDAMLMGLVFMSPMIVLISLWLYGVL